MERLAEMSVVGSAGMNRFVVELKMVADVLGFG